MLRMLAIGVLVISVVLLSVIVFRKNLALDGLVCSELIWYWLRSRYM